jgi:hypothetical protein
MKKNSKSLFGFKSQRLKFSKELMLTIVLTGIFSAVTYNGLKYVQRDVSTKKLGSTFIQIDSNQQY